ncbi:ABC transporter ATP-binding protein [Rhizobium leguminosarum]|uniref:ABC transporter ATP-binding protein n=1 Tax=Rhizobium leguminosarum TaxID=384 RepID=UPI001C91F420|nr:sn-glycerol-3-phosphate ABC transporter ATP-binding protein UgpC [Rhizobium leguminosarum]MBY3002050.1 sn-glycerol-3-phosphate ABC transporter ATP-binding protein UgpC [Rhizobium leguminosarum]
MASVSIRNTQKAYGATKVIHGVDVEIQDGEFVVLVGPSGCGKSTLLRMLAGLESISGGTIAIGDKVVNDVAPKQRDIAMVFQNYALYPHMTVAENMSFSLKLQKVPEAEQKAKVEEASRILGLDPLLRRYPKELSGGQRQRVAMGRALVRNPQVFLFDEPLSNLDAKLRVQMRAEIKQLHQRLRTTTVYVTHDQIEAMTMADRIVVMRDGRVEQIGAPLELYDRPANLFVASFLGSPGMNFLSGKVSASDPTLFETAGGGRIELGRSHDQLAGRSARLGLRPENWAITTSNEGALDVVVEVVEPTGAETMLILTHGGERLTVPIRERTPVQPGERLWLRATAAATHLFDSDTGARLN